MQVLGFPFVSKNQISAFQLMLSFFLKAKRKLNHVISWKEHRQGSGSILTNHPNTQTAPQFTRNILRWNFVSHVQPNLKTKMGFQFGHCPREAHLCILQPSAPRCEPCPANLQPHEDAGIGAYKLNYLVTFSSIYCHVVHKIVIIIFPKECMNYNQYKYNICAWLYSIFLSPTPRAFYFGLRHHSLPVLLYYFY